MLALSSPLFVVNYLTTPEPWHDFFGMPWFASAMSGVAFMSGLILSAVCWLGLGPKTAPPPEPAEAAVRRLLRQGDLLEVRAARIVNSGDEAGLEHLAYVPFFPLPVVGSSQAMIETEAALVDVATATTDSITAQIFAFFDAHSDAVAALGLTSCAASGKTISILVTRSDRIAAVAGKDVSPAIRCGLLAAFKRARSLAGKSEPQDRTPAEGMVPFDQWNELWGSLEEQLAGSERRPSSIFAPLPWTKEQARVYAELPVMAHIHRPIRADLSVRPAIVSGLRDAYERASSRWRADRSPERLVYDARAAAGWGGMVADALVAHKDRPPLFAVPGGVHDVMALTDARGKDMGLTQLVAALSAADAGKTTHAMVHRVDDTHAEVTLVSAPV
jgi:hypothetical protein